MKASNFRPSNQGDIFSSQHGSWNRSVRAGYEVIRVPLHQTGHASGEYEDFLTGFVTAKGEVWGRPVGVTVAPDGSLLVTDDGVEFGVASELRREQVASRPAIGNEQER